MLVPVEDAIADVQQFWREFSIDKIDKVVVVGGSTRILKVRDILKEYFGKDKVYIHPFPEEAIAQGAAWYAFSRANKKMIE